MFFIHVSSPLRFDMRPNLTDSSPAQIIYAFYHHRREMNSYLTSTTNTTNTSPSHSSPGLSQSHFTRMLLLGCFDILITLPIVVLLLAIDILSSSSPFSFYQGWTYDHTGWAPVFVTKDEWDANKWNRVLLRWDEWINPFFALVFFVLFGLTGEAREGYRRALRAVIRPFSRKRGGDSGEGLPEVVFKVGKDVNETFTSSSDTSRE